MSQEAVRKQPPVTEEKKQELLGFLSRMYPVDPIRRLQENRKKVLRDAAWEVLPNSPPEHVPQKKCRAKKKSKAKPVPTTIPSIPDEPDEELTVTDLKKKILLDLCVTPGTVIPTAIGASLLLLSVVLGTGAAFLGFVCCLLGFGALLTNWVFNLEGISKRAAKEWSQAQQVKKDRELDRLDQNLQQTREVRDETALRNLRALYSSFCADFQEGKLSKTIPPMMLAQIDQIFEKCIVQLGRSYDVWKQTQLVQGDFRSELISQRREMLDEVDTSVELLASAINEVRALRLKTSRSELRQLQEKLASQLSVAKAVEERVAELEGLGTPTEERYSEYLGSDGSST